MVHHPGLGHLDPGGGGADRGGGTAARGLDLRDAAAADRPAERRARRRAARRGPGGSALRPPLAADDAAARHGAAGRRGGRRPGGAAGPSAGDHPPDRRRRPPPGVPALDRAGAGPDPRGHRPSRALGARGAGDPPGPAAVPGDLHRDFHPGNILFSGTGAELRISGVVDWAETSWGPADLDVAHCSTALALLHGPAEGLRFAARYTAAGGVLDPDPEAHLYWRLLDALAYAPDAQQVATPWRELGRTDLTPAVLTDRPEEYLAALLVSPR
ncbi:phosphotransferase family protein [Kitasatospora sp. NPDC101801]|uniref:phosphotransferase family protein n=1 Tax=Kitasatospora sp. NPDC101801 TaxID=3364103 RepID=UPI003817388D